MMHFAHIQTPIGNLRLRASDRALIAVDHTNQQSHTDDSWIENSEHPVLQQAAEELEHYFAGKITTFHTLLAPSGTDFQQQVWQALKSIPYGASASYSDIAQLIDNPQAVRAVGAANAQNPLSIFIPCHRVIGKNDSLTGYAGGINNKSYLLELEKAFSAKN
jgi:methylated-DNA-[protein]-cysteine S-methyltransferase